MFPVIAYVENEDETKIDLKTLQELWIERKKEEEED